MEFMPLTIRGQNVYAGFWKRLFAGVVDGFVVMPLGFLFIWLEGLDRTLAIFIVIFSTMLFSMYSVYFNARFGGTLGKMVVGIRITRPDGSRIGWLEAWKRSSVDLAFAAVVLFVQVWVLMQVDPHTYESMAWKDRPGLAYKYVTWFGAFVWLQTVWYWSEFVVLLCNKRKRSLHDFIAGTVVIQEDFVGYVVREDAARIAPHGLDTQERSNDGQVAGSLQV